MQGGGEIPEGCDICDVVASLDWVVIEGNQKNK